MRFCATLLLMLALCGACFANDQSKLSPELRNKKIIVVDKAMFIGNHQLTGDELDAVFSSNDDAASAYSTALHFYYPGLVLAYAGGFAVGYGITDWIYDYTGAGMYITLGGVGIIGLSILLTRTGNSYLLDAIEIFNKGIEINETSLRLKVVPTEQGGLALAFAF